MWWKSLSESGISAIYTPPPYNVWQLVLNCKDGRKSDSVENTRLAKALFRLRLVFITGLNGIITTMTSV